MCHWVPWFKVAALYEPADNVTVGCFVQVTPKQHRGSTSIETVTKSKLTGRLGFAFQRQNYEYYSAGDPTLASMTTADLVGSADTAAVVLMASPTTGPTSGFTTATGLKSSELPLLTEQFGKNKLSIATPQFLDLFKQQLLSPLAMFQPCSRNRLVNCLLKHWSPHRSNDPGVSLLAELRVHWNRSIQQWPSLGDRAAAPYTAELLPFPR